MMASHGSRGVGKESVPLIGVISFILLESLKCPRCPLVLAATSSLIPHCKASSLYSFPRISWAQEDWSAASSHLGQGETMWSPLANLRGYQCSHFNPGSLALPMLCPGRRDGFLSFHCVWTPV